VLLPVPMPPVTSSLTGVDPSALTASVAVGERLCAGIRSVTVG
jgi:hypothetical protein